MSVEYLEGMAMWQRSTNSTNFLQEGIRLCTFKYPNFLALSFAAVTQLLQPDGLSRQNPENIGGMRVSKSS